MNFKIKDLAIDTIFSIAGYTFKKGALGATVEPTTEAWAIEAHYPRRVGLLQGQNADGTLSIEPNYTLGLERAYFGSLGAMAFAIALKLCPIKPKS